MGAAARVHVRRPGAGQTGRAGTELQLRHRPDVPLFGQRRNRRRRSHQQQGVFSETRAAVHGTAFGVHAAGVCYRVDLRLRPDGRLGEICLSQEGAIHYYQTRARDWELQMLIKARTAAGDRALGRALLETVESRIYSTTLDFSAVESVRPPASASTSRPPAAGAPPRASTSNWRAAASATSNFWCSVCSGCTADARPGCATAARCWRWAACATRICWPIRNTRAWPPPISSCAPSNTGCSSTRTARPTRCPRRRPDSRRWRAACRRPRLGTAASAETLLGELNAHLEGVQEIYERVIHAQRPIYYMTPAPPS